VQTAFLLTGTLLCCAVPAGAPALPQPAAAGNHAQQDRHPPQLKDRDHGMNMAEHGHVLFKA
jgi:Spy/CpxP family protein refolding chaperone